MKDEIKKINSTAIRVITLDTLVIGTGCAGYNAADSLYDLGVTDIAMVTEGVKMGTSRNTGSDKQTYYKLSLASTANDSIFQLAENLFNGGGVNGDTALCEAAGSVRAFMKLVNLGVPFPTNSYGEYVGYKTDHDPYQRATSCGPLTSKIMTEQLEKSVAKKKITIFDGMQAVRLVVRDSKLLGVLCIDLNRISDTDSGFTLFAVNHAILATGGPSAVYYHSVFPESQTGNTGMALIAGAAACNLQEWQYGLASTKFRWNVSGTYQQVLPRYIAIDANGNEREFLPEYFSAPEKALDMVFLKGYQWPFDVRKVGENGSSVIDLIVHHEIFNKGNRVYMDFTREPSGLENGFDSISVEAREYLTRSGALLKTPIERLKKMNSKAIELYAAHGIDITKEPLEVSVCAQHQNGGIAVDIHWRTNINGLYTAGEAAGSFGIYRPGGSALNATQVGSFRAAEHISMQDRTTPSTDITLKEAQSLILELIENLEKCQRGSSNVTAQMISRQKRMSEYAAHLRYPEKLSSLADDFKGELESFWESTVISSCNDIPYAFKSFDTLITQLALLDAMACCLEKAGSRGSGLLACENGDLIIDSLPNLRYQQGNAEYDCRLIETEFENGSFISRWKQVRPLPKTDDWFENVWNEYNKARKI